MQTIDMKKVATAEQLVRAIKEAQESEEPFMVLAHTGSQEKTSLELVRGITTSNQRRIPVLWSFANEPNPLSTIGNREEAR